MTSLFAGEKLQLTIADKVATLTFNAAGSVNKFDKETNSEFTQVVDALEQHGRDIAGLLVTSAKSVFIAGADITEFTAYFAEEEAAIAAWIGDINQVFSRFEDLPFPKVAAINGVALGGGCEMTLVCDYRVMATTAQIGLPEVNLGIFPGFGGSVRAPRIVGLDNALELIAGGKPLKAQEALAMGLVDAVVAQEDLLGAAMQTLQLCIDGKLDWQARQQEKHAPLLLSVRERTMALESAKAVIFAKANPKHYPALALAVETIAKHSTLPRDEALSIETANFAKAAKTAQATALVGVFLADQQVKKVAKNYSKNAKDIARAGVIGAGIMGGGIAYQSAKSGVPVVMKDLSEAQLALGMGEAISLLDKQVARQKLTPAKLGEILARITPTTAPEAFVGCDIVIEAVTENLAIKQQVLTQAEQQLADSAILASNTSTIAISELAKSLSRPENFVGMHFFNPVPKMPLVEVIRGEQTSEQTIATTVAYAQKMGKVPIVVNDCAGFFVNRVLFPYFAAFEQLIADGADFVQIDKVMEGFGFPMGPAYLMDVVGIDTGVHGAQVMATAYPERMAVAPNRAIATLYAHKRLGQKNDVGFYRYELDKKGKTLDPSVYDILYPNAPIAFSDEEIIARLMLAMGNETVRCLAENIVEYAAFADMALLLGLGFPPFRGGVCRYIDQLGVANYVALCDKYSHLGAAYVAPNLIKAMASNGTTFYGNA